MRLKYLNEFLKQKSIDDVKLFKVGELFEHTIEIEGQDVTYTYGNGELFIHTDHDTYELSVSNARGFDELVWD